MAIEYIVTIHAFDTKREYEEKYYLNCLAVIMKS